jgi:UDPglucose--hexose-1-phosphate uridylyltransferase
MSDDTGYRHMTFDPAEHPHRRFNPLNGEWILVSPHRARRPWQGQENAPDTDQLPDYDNGCYLCPGNMRITGEQNPDYKDVFVFENDFAALLPDTPSPPSNNPLFRDECAQGISRVICYSPDHSKSMSMLNTHQIRTIVDVWAAQSEELGVVYQNVQLFENKGAMMGCSNPHPHGQIWATSYIPAEVAKEDRAQRDWSGHAPMLLELAEKESGGPRVVAETKHWLAIVPYWASWPFEIMLLPRFSVQQMPQLNAVQRDDLAIILKQITVRYDNLFGCSFPYSFGWHGAPFTDSEKEHWQLHAHFYPPLLRSAEVRKFMVGYEMMAEAQRDLTPEQAAERLRAVFAVHYREVK